MLIPDANFQSKLNISQKFTQSPLFKSIAASPSFSDSCSPIGILYASIL